MEKKIQNDIKQFGPEWIVLEQIAKMEEGYENIIQEIVSSEPFHWGEVIEQAMSHKMFPMLCYTFMSEKLFPLIPPFINQNFTINYLVNKRKTKLIKEQTLKIVEALNQNEIDVACTKGIILDDQIYGNRGYRFLSDVDFMAKQENKQDIAKILQRLGYNVGTVDWKTNSITEMERAQYLKYINTKEKLPEYVININDDIFKYVSVGFVFSFTWEKCPYQVDVAEALQEILYLPAGLNESAVLPAMSNPYHFIYIIMHLYKHAWVEHFQKWRNDVNLVKFADVYHFWNKSRDELKKELPHILEKHNLQEPVMWVLYHTDEIFDSHIVKELGMTNVLSEKYLFSANDQKGRICQWTGNMRERLWLKDRAKVVSMQS